MTTDEKRIETALGNAEMCEEDYSGMTYQQGVAEALMWILGLLSDDDFGY